MRITSTVINRLLISTGLGVLITIGGAILAELMVQASDRFGWPMIIGGGVGVILLLFVIDTITSVFSPEQ